jgi:N-methylhydantoinase A
LVLGYLDPDYFLGGSMRLDADAAREVLDREVGSRLGLSSSQAASAILKVMTEHMVTAIQDITINQGIDPRSAALVAGGGAGGFNAVAIARRLGCPRVVIPQVAAVLSATGALMSDLSDDFSTSFWTTTTTFDFDMVNEILAQLDVRCRDFIEGPGKDSLESRVEFSVEAHYPNQAWELEIPLRGRRFADKHDVEELEKAFHAMHQDVFAISDPASPVEILAWRARVSCRLHNGDPGQVLGSIVASNIQRSRTAYWPELGDILTDVWVFDEMSPETRVTGPAIIESAVTTVVVEPGATAERKRSGSLLISPYTEDHNSPLDTNPRTVEASRR